MAIKHALLQDYESSGMMPICLASLCLADGDEEQVSMDSDKVISSFPWDILYSTDDLLQEAPCDLSYVTDEETGKLPAGYCYSRISRTLRRTLRRAPSSLVKKVEGLLKTVFLVGSTTMTLDSPYQRSFVHATCHYYGLISTTEGTVITIKTSQTCRNIIPETFESPEMLNIPKMPEMSLSDYLSINVL
jgi:hypothetical protein